MLPKAKFLRPSRMKSLRGINYLFLTYEACTFYVHYKVKVIKYLAKTDIKKLTLPQLNVCIKLNF
jgi:hypothetical protein